MVISINIDDTFKRPQPPKRVSKRGTITFIATIEERGRPDILRNLTRGVDKTDDEPGLVPVYKALDNIHISFALSSLINIVWSYNPPPPPETDEPYVDSDAVALSLAKNYLVNISLPLPPEDTMITTPDDITVIA
jgi:hypothetical protein